MRAGFRAIPVSILLRELKDGTPPDTRWNSRTPVPSDQKVWRTGMWAGIKGQASQGGEETVANEVAAHTRQNFYFDWMDVYEPDAQGRVLDESMAIQVDGEIVIWDIDRIDPDYENRRDVRVVAIRRRLMA